MNRLLRPVLPLLLFSLLAPAAHASIEWSVTKQLNLEKQPLDAASSADGKTLYILTPGEVIVYGLPEYKVLTTIPVEKGLNRMSYSLRDNQLILMSSADKTVKVIQLETVYQFSLQGVPVKGPKNAPVTLVVFSDYQ